MEVLSAAGSLAGVVGAAYQIYSTHRDRRERQPAGPIATSTATQVASPRATPATPAPAPAPAQAMPQAPVPARQVGRAEPRPMAPPPAADHGTLFDIFAPFIMGTYLWLMALGGFSYIQDVNLAGPTPEAITTQLRYTIVLLVVNAIWAGALVFRHVDKQPRPARVWVYGLAGVASVVAGIGLLMAYSSRIF